MIKNLETKNKIFVSCGEMSGDLHLSYLVEEIKKIKNNVQFYGVVGEKSIKAGAIEISNIKNNDIMGFSAIIKKYSYFKKKIVEYIDFIKKENIKNVILVDYGGFNLIFFKKLKKEIPNIKVTYYIPPKVWAWGKGRIKTLKKLDDVIVIFPFEEEYFENENMKVTYLGNPFVDKYNFSEKIGDKVLLLPGSRKQEILKVLPLMLKYVEQNKQEKFILRLAHENHIAYLKEILSENGFSKNFIEGNKNLEIRYENFEQMRDEIKYSIATSGTVTFEMSLMGIPTIAVYKTNFINEFIARRIVKVKYLSLTNLSMNKAIFPELIQKDYNIENLKKESMNMEANLTDINKELKEMRELMGSSNVLNRIAMYVVERLN